MIESRRHVDMLIIGAGLSGIGAAARLGQEHPGHGYLVLESRAASGGTWDLFRYPGIRSDSDMFTLGYRFKPWTRGEGAGRRPVDPRLRPRDRARVRRRASASATATASSPPTGTPRPPAGPSPPRRPTAHVTFSSRASSGRDGLLRLRRAYAAVSPGLDDFAGRVVHPQHWPGGPRRRRAARGRGRLRRHRRHAGAGAGRARRRARHDAAALADLRAVAAGGRPGRPRACGGGCPRRRPTAPSGGRTSRSRRRRYQLARRRPSCAAPLRPQGQRRRAARGLRRRPHFKPAYDPWDQRLCLVPDGDLFRAIRARHGRRSSPTRSRPSPPTGSGSRRAPSSTADVVVTATGLKVLPFGGIDLAVDGEQVKVPGDDGLPAR